MCFCKPFVLFPLFCNGRALDRVTKQKHRPNRQKLSKKSPKIVFSAPSDIFRHFSDILSTFPFSGLSNDLPVTTLVPQTILGCPAERQIIFFLICGFPCLCQTHTCLKEDKEVASQQVRQREGEREREREREGESEIERQRASHLHSQLLSAFGLAGN